ncbi:MAG TPA: hypothetical protein VME70_02475 [Mycobacteriales bacterium]|nr:hypothetical protein [Mycobacteriales bacterium]
MTESTTMPPAGAATDEGVGMLPVQPDGDGPEGGNRRRLLILGGAAGVIVLAAAAFLLLHKGGSSTPTAAVVPHATVSAQASSQPSSTGKTHKGGTTTLPKVNKHPAARDPFIPLITAPVDTGGSPVSQSTVPASSPSSTPSSGTSPSPNPSSSHSGGGTKAAGGPLWIELTGTKGQTAKFKVGYAHHKFREYTVQAPGPSSDQGTVFDKIFALISVQNGEATVQIGDAAPFVLTTGVAHAA